MEDASPCIFDSHCHACWRHGNAKIQDISIHGIDQIILEFVGFRVRRFRLFLLWKWPYTALFISFLSASSFQPYFTFTSSILLSPCSLERELDMKGFKFIFYMEWLHRNWGRTIGMVYLLPLMYFWSKGYIAKAMKPRLIGYGGLLGLQVWRDFEWGLYQIFSCQLGFAPWVLFTLTCLTHCPFGEVAVILKVWWSNPLVSWCQLQNYSTVNATEPLPWEVNIGSGKGLVPLTIFFGVQLTISQHWLS